MSSSTWIVALPSARQVNPRIQIIQVSATRGDYLDAWYGWLREQVKRRTVEAPLM